MLPIKKNKNQLGFYSTFEEQLNHQHGLYILANTICWQTFETAFSKHYSENMGAPAKPIRLMVSLLILKHVRNLSDESVVEQWAENSYYQYFSGEEYFSSKHPCVPTELVEFRKRIGEEGMELILKESIRINGKDGQKDTLSGDTTVQEKNITYPTDDKLYKKIIKKCHQIAEKEDVELRQSYTRTVKQLSFVQRLKRKKGGEAKARKASKKIKTIAGRLVRDLDRKLTSEGLQRWGGDLFLFNRVLTQKKDDSDKIYSLHEPQVKCFSKGKEHKKYEFGSKSAILVTQDTGVIVGALNFSDNIHDIKTLPAALEQHKRLTGIEAKHVYVDRGYPGTKQICTTQIHMPRPDNQITPTKRKRHRRRAAIEPVIGHLKQNYRLSRNFLKGSFGDAINLMLAAAAMNFKRIMNLWKAGCNFFVFLWIALNKKFGCFVNMYIQLQNLKYTF
jgi:IS5 family transposase